jgi:superfamily II DNA or RNA helicase
MIPLAHQRRFTEKAPKKYGVWHACGVGKTMTGLFTVVNRASNCLIVCPKGVKSKWLEAVKLFPSLVTKVMTKEEFKKAAPTLPYYDAVIIDEAHHFSGIKSDMHKSMVKYIKRQKIQQVYPMTATPYRREAWNIYALAKIMGHEWDYINFRNIFYREQRFGPRVVWVPKAGMEQEIATLVRAIGDVVAYSECGDLPPIQHKVEYLNTTPAQKNAMKMLEKLEANPLTFYLREHQIMSGVFMDQPVHTEKAEYIRDLCEANKKVAVFCRYTDQIEYLKNFFENFEQEVYVIDGKTKDKNETANDIEGATRCIALIQADSAEGFELPTIDVIVFASMSYSYLAYTQSMGRFIRINKQNTPKLFIYLLTKDTIDEEVYKNIMKKQNFDLAIYSKEHEKI